MDQSKTAQPSIEKFDSPFFFFSLNHEDEITYLSPSADEVLRLDSAQVIGKKCSDFFDDSSFPRVASNPFDLLSLETIEPDLERCSLSLVNFATRVLRVQIYRSLGTGQSTTRCGIAIDVTNRWEKEEELRGRLDELNQLLAELTRREQRVLGYLPQGRTIKNIARALNLSQRGIEHIKSRLTNKLGVNSTAQLISITKEQECLSRFFERREQSDLI